MIGPYINGFSLRIFIFLLDYVPGLASFLFWDRISALRKLNLDECPTNFPLPLPKEYFGIEETKVSYPKMLIISILQSFFFFYDKIFFFFF